MAAPTFTRPIQGTAPNQFVENTADVAALNATLEALWLAIVSGESEEQIQEILDAAIAAVTAQELAEAARDSSFANAKGAATIADARALVDDTETFIVYAEGAETFDAYRRLTSSTEQFLGTYPSADLVLGALTRSDTGLRGAIGLTDLGQHFGARGRCIALVQPGWLYQDVEKTNPAVSDGDEVRVIADQSGLGHDVVLDSGDPAILRRDGLRLWLEVDSDTGSYGFPNSTFDFLRQNASAAFCADTLNARNVTVQITTSASSGLQIAWASAGDSLSFRPHSGSAGTVFAAGNRDTYIQRRDGPHFAALTVDEPAGVVRAWSGDLPPVVAAYNQGTSATPLSGSGNNVPVRLMGAPAGTAEKFVGKFFGVAWFDGLLTDDDVALLREAMDPPATRIGLPAIQRAIAVDRTGALSPYARVQPILEDAGIGFLLRVSRFWCWQDLAMTLPVRRIGDPVRVMLDQHNGLLAIAPSNEARGTYGTNGLDEWIVFNGTTTTYQITGVGPFLRNESYLAVRAEFDDLSASGAQVLFGANSSSVITNTQIGIRKRANEAFLIGDRGEVAVSADGVDPGDAVFSVLINDEQIVGFLDGDQTGTASHGTTGNTFNTGSWWIGSDRGVGQFFAGRFFGAVMALDALGPDDRFLADLSLRNIGGGGGVAMPDPVVQSVWIGDVQ